MLDNIRININHINYTLAATYPKQWGATVGTLGAYLQSGAYSLGTYSLGAYSLGAYSLGASRGLQFGGLQSGPRILDPLVHSPLLRAYIGPYNASVV